MYIDQQMTMANSLRSYTELLLIHFSQVCDSITFQKPVALESRITIRLVDSLFYQVQCVGGLC